LRIPYSKPGWVTGEIVFDDLPGRKVRGYQVIYDRNHAGSWRVSLGGVGEEMIRFAFTSEYDRGINWTSWSGPSRPTRCGSSTATSEAPAIQWVEAVMTTSADFADSPAEFSAVTFCSQSSETSSAAKTSAVCQDDGAHALHLLADARRVTAG
jgi:hypothetical protein